MNSRLEENLGVLGIHQRTEPGSEDVVVLLGPPCLHLTAPWGQHRLESLPRSSNDCTPGQTNLQLCGAQSMHIGRLLKLSSDSCRGDSRRLGLNTRRRQELLLSKTKAGYWLICLHLPYFIRTVISLAHQPKEELSFLLPLNHVASQWLILKNRADFMFFADFPGADLWILDFAFRAAAVHPSLHSFNEKKCFCLLNKNLKTAKFED